MVGLAERTSGRRPTRRTRKPLRTEDSDSGGLGSGTSNWPPKGVPRRLRLKEDKLSATRDHSGAPRAPACWQAPPVDAALGPRAHYLAERAWRAKTRSHRSHRTRRIYLLCTDGFAHVADIMVGSVYDSNLEEGCAFQELISFFTVGSVGPQTRPFILHPADFPLPEEDPRGRNRCTACSRAGGGSFRRRAGRSAAP